MADAKEQAIDSTLREDRVFPPPERFSADAFVPSRAHYDELYRQSIDDPDGFWSERAAQLHWMRPWDRVLEWTPPFAKWFVGGRLNVADNCLDRHLHGPRRNKAALIWVGEPCAPDTPAEVRTLTYQQLHREVCKFANVLKSLGVSTGDRVGIYLPMIPEAAVAMLACARIGATHSVVFGGFSAEAVRDRMNDAGAKVVVTADGGYRRGSVVPLKANVDAAVAQTPSVTGVVVVRRTGDAVTMQGGRDHWWHELMSAASPDCPAEPLDSEHPLFILYTSGTTGKPKGVVHSTAGYLLHATAERAVGVRSQGRGHLLVHGRHRLGDRAQLRRVRHPRQRRDVGHVRRRAELPEPGSVLADHRRPRRHDLLHCADGDPRLHQVGRRVAAQARLDSLRLLGSVGEPINPEAWMWYHRIIGKERCPIVDTWWQTETGGIMIAPLPGATPTKPGSATLPLPGIVPEVRTRDGQVVPPEPGRLPRRHAAVARHAADRLRRSRALHAAVLEPDARHLLHRRRRAARRRRLLLGDGPHRRRGERRRAIGSARWRSRARSCRIRR